MIGVITRNTRRTRLRKKADTYTLLANSLDAHDADAAAALRALVNDVVQALVVAERKALGKRFNTDTFIGVIAFLVVTAGMFGVALSLDSAWLRVPLYIIAVLIALFSLIGGATQIWTSHDDAANNDGVSNR